ncbi:DNA repair protein RAD50 [Dendroctonus ponderosae]|uniref:DNA repair protein RAD50 n=1 Tax=Dendroctonus ponderosae TaxID=77166 RepID=UPI0020356E02|nr:DNA repair protein RAD50 [Dendroctonus ponderosae]XP_048517473.1 DNA repair protein RAD50 [Dendroctonus ponderosae]
MAVLDRLHIRGIRSFGPNDEEKVKFSVPLTLFLGQNGCGKTTIIECIKYALTGDLPSGSDSGRGFVNDPKLSSKSSTKGSIKLKFNDFKGDSITVAKFVEVTTLAAGKLRFKNISNALQWKDNQGRAQETEQKCADIDLYCAQKLNVSKAIINNVIFCHQENSSWPLEEAKKLKEKFDEIFGATEYNKCVDKLRKLIKEKKVYVKLLKEQFTQKKMAKQTTDKLRDRLCDEESRLERIQTIIDEKRNEIKPLRIRLNEVHVIIDSITETHAKLTGLETRLKGVMDQQSALAQHIQKEFSGTDEELENEILNFDNFKDEGNREILKIESKKSAIEAKVAEITIIIQDEQVTLGQLKQEKVHHTKRCEEFKELIQKAKVKFDLECEESESVYNIIDKLNNKYSTKEKMMINEKKIMDEKEGRLQSNIDRIRSKLAAAEENSSSKSKLLNETNIKLGETKCKLGRLSHSHSQLESTTKKMKKFEDDLTKKKDEFDEGQASRQLEDLEEQITQKEQLQTKLDREYKTLQQNYWTDQKIESETSTLLEKRAEVAALKEKHEHSFAILFKEDVLAHELEMSIASIQNREEQKATSLSKSISTNERKIASLEAGVKNVREKLEAQQEELKRNKEKIERVCEGKPYSEVLNQSHTKKETLQKNKGTYRSATTIFANFISEFEQEAPCCPVCDTSFASKKSLVPKIITKLKTKIEDLPRKLADTEAQLIKEEEFYNKLQQLKQVNENIQVIEEAKIPLLQEELQENEDKLEDLKLELASLKNDLTEPENLVGICRKVLSDAALIDRLSQEITKSEDLLETLRKDLISVPSSRSFEETETQLHKLKSELKNLTVHYKSKRDLFDETREGIRKLITQLQMETQKQLEMQKILQEQPMLEKQICEYKKSIPKLKEEIKSVTEKVATYKKELSEAESKRSETVLNNSKLLEEYRLNVDACSRLIEEIAKLQKTIQGFEQGDVSARLESIKNSLDGHKSDIEKLEQTKKLLINAVVKKKEDLASQESKLRSFKDNKELRASRMKSKQLKSEVQELRMKIGSHNSKSICDEQRKIMDNINTKETEISRKIGEEDSLKDLIHKDTTELNKKEHREVVTEYKKKYYELRVEELAVIDLEVYTEALEKSILKFHQERMVQINMTIRELWRNIYRGNDIDYIEIQTVDDIGGGGARKRSYNYKVVQVKKGTDLEMRGRCSAGQKVLASLVIRMALAETFSANCGILALDEPTTNLDRDNITSLSEALSRIITAREGQKNFQLLIITHDEEFLQTLTRNQSVSHYYRVQRNFEGFSEIQKQSL